MTTLPPGVVFENGAGELVFAWASGFCATEATGTAFGLVGRTVAAEVTEGL
jgi:hypothetical protein